MRAGRSLVARLHNDARWPAQAHAYGSQPGRSVLSFDPVAAAIASHDSIGQHNVAAAKAKKYFFCCQHAFIFQYLENVIGNSIYCQTTGPCADRASRTPAARTSTRTRGTWVTPRACPLRTATSFLPPRCLRRPGNKEKKIPDKRVLYPIKLTELGYAGSLQRPCNINPEIQRLSQVLYLLSLLAGHCA